MTQETEPVIRVRGLRKTFKKVEAVKSVSLEVYKGEVFGLLGPNGAGKTTTLEIMEGLQRADAGEVSIKGMQHQDSSRMIRLITGIQLQATALYDKIRVEEVIELFRSYYPVALSLDVLLDTVSLQEKRRAMVKQLSGGQKQRLALALALVHDPEIIFLDEPTTGLDPQARRNIWEVILMLSSQGKTIIMTTHYMDEAEQLCDRIAIMDAGEIKHTDTPSGLIKLLPSEAFISVPYSGVLSALPMIEGVVHTDIQAGMLMLESKDLTMTLKSMMQSETLPELLSLHEMNIRKASLEDVFIYLTGKTLRE
jgi:ABC-2 type transport system ATP-binding protein